MNLENVNINGMQLIHKSDRFCIYRGEWNNQPVIIKAIGSLTESRSLNEALQNEFNVLKTINAPGIARVLTTLNLFNHKAIVVKDAGKENLAEFVTRKKISLSDFFDMAISLTQALQFVHEKNVIHRDINPSNIVINETLQPTLIDFELATSISGSRGGVQGALEGTLLYMAPEQTGRMDRLVDHRADLYSLGATLYFALTTLPIFQETDLAELIRLNLAVMPKSPHQVDGQVPISLSEIIMKLLSKMPDQRYQSAKALLMDLLESKERWLHGIDEAFDLGREDLVQMLPFPEGLYGRTSDLSKLKSLVDKVNAGEKKIVLISGVAGIGKTALVNEISKNFLVHQVLTGKCDQVHTEIPFAAISNACQSYVQTLFLLSKKQKEDLAQKLNKALYPNGRVLTEIVPALEKLIGVQPPVDLLGPVETENRLHLMFKAFFRILSENEKGLLLFVDDLQWADLSSLRLLKALILDSDIQNLLIIGAFRSEEAGELAHFNLDGVSLLKLNIEPLTQTAVSEFLCDLLQVGRDVADNFAAVLMKKTAGNPFFIKRLLRYLQKNEFLTFAIDTNQWHWDLEEIENIEVSENVIDLMIQAIQELPDEARQTLLIMACIGHSADLNLLALCADKTPEEMARTLWPALHEQLVLPVRSQSAAYMFVHDRVQQAVYSLLTSTEKTDTHHNIGHKMLKAFAHELEVHIFEITDQLNLGSSKISDVQEKIQLAHLNCQAGKKARTSAAFEPSLRYYKSAIANLQNLGWSEHHALMFTAHLGAAECSFLIGQQVQGNQFAEIALAQAITNLEKADIYSLRIMESSLRGDFTAAIDWGIQGLTLLGFAVPKGELATSVMQNLAQVGQTIGERNPEDLLLLPEAKDPEIIAAIRLYSELIPPAWFSNPQVLPYLNLQIVILSLNHGYTVCSATGFAAYAMILANLGDYKKAYDFGQFALTKARRYNNASKECEVLLILVDFVNHWQSSYSESQALFRLGLSKALEAGNLLWGSFIISGRLAFWSLIGMSVDSHLKEIISTLEFNRKVGSRPTFEMCLPYRQLAFCLLGQTSAQGSLENADFNEEQFLKEAQLNPPALACYRICQLQAAYLFNNKDDTLILLQEAEKFVPYVLSHFAELEFQFYAPLVLASHGDLTKLKTYSQKYQAWSQLCPENFLHRYLLIQAEISRLENQSQTNTLVFYEQAVTKAEQGGFFHDEALASELCGRYLLKTNIERLASVYIRNAFDKYTQWGATAKASSLQEEFFEYTQKEKPPSIYLSGSEGVKDSFVDMYSLLKSSEKMSSELVLNKLLEQLFEIGLRVAGAERGALVLKEKGELVVRAIGSSVDALVIEKTILSRSHQMSVSVVEHVFETHEAMVLSEAWRSGPFVNDPYIKANKIKSILAVPILRAGKRIGVFYFENNLATRAFTKNRVESLRLLSTQIATAIENSLLFEKLNDEIEKRTKAEKEAQFLSGISVLLSESLDYESTLKKVTSMIVPQWADWCTLDIIVNIDGHAQNIQHISSSSDFNAKDVAEEVIRSGLAQEIGAIISVPLIARNRVIGALTLSAKKRDQFTSANLPLTEEIARRSAMAIENAQLYTEAQKSIKLRDDFISLASHELRTPLTPMKMQVHMMKNYLYEANFEASKVSFLLKMVEGANRQIERLSILVEDMLNVSRLSANELMLDLEFCDLSKLLRKVLKNREDFIGKSKSSIVTKIQDNVTGQWDQKRLEQIIINLFTNALKYGEDKPIEISLIQEDHYAELSFQDNGIGIADADIPKLFQRFVRLVSVKHYGGFGLGLYIVRRLVEAHGGDIQVKSILNQGTKFTVRLPIRDDLLVSPR